MINKKLIILLLILILIALVGLVWATLRAPKTSETPGTNQNNEPGFPLGDLNPINNSLTAGNNSPPFSANEPFINNPSSNPRLTPLTDQPIADFWLEEDGKSSSSPLVSFVTRRSNETFSLLLEGGDPTASTSTKPILVLFLPNVNPFSLLTGWQISRPNPNILLAQTTPTAAGPGVILSINTKTNAARQIVGGLNGLSGVMSPDGQILLYSFNEPLGLKLNLLNLASNQTTTLPLITLAEKCVFSALNKIYCAVPRLISFANYPDAWYRGENTSSDQIWSIDTQTLETKLVFEGLIGGATFDIISLTPTKNNDWLVFRTKGDWRGWKFDLREDFSGASTTTPGQ